MAEPVVAYIRFVDNHYQIIQKTLNGKLSVLFDTNTPIYSLSFDDVTQTLLFNHYQNNDRTVLYTYSFVSEKVNPYIFKNVITPNKIYSHYYQMPQNLLFFVGLKGRKPTIYGLNRNAEFYQHQISGFSKIRSLTKGKSNDELLVVGILSVYSRNLVCIA